MKVFATEEIGTADVVLYEVPATLEASIPTLFFHNKTGSAVDLTLKVYDHSNVATGDIWPENIEADGKFVFARALLLNEGDKLIAVSSAIASIDATLCGISNEAVPVSGPLNPTGDWNSGASYVVRDLVFEDSTSWICVAPNTNSSPTLVNANWMVLAQKGQAGVAGFEADGSIPMTGPIDLAGNDIVNGADIVAKTSANGIATALTDAPLATGTATVLAVTTAITLGSLVDGVQIKLKAPLASTAAATLNVDGLGAKPIRRQGDSTIEAGDMVAGGTYELRYDANYDAASGAWVLLNGSVLPVPPGSIIYIAADTAPTGYLKADGAAVSRIAYAALFAAIGTVWGVGNGTTSFDMPDLRGEFIRAWDDGRGADTGRVFASAQSDELRSHYHTGTQRHTSSYPMGGGGGSAKYPTNGAVNTASTGGSETRPRNVALLACIKY